MLASLTISIPNYWLGVVSGVVVTIIAMMCFAYWAKDEQGDA